MFFLYPETSNRTLEELAFRKFSRQYYTTCFFGLRVLTDHLVFEEDEYRERMAAAVEKNITYDTPDNLPEEQATATKETKVV